MTDTTTRPSGSDTDIKGPGYRVWFDAPARTVHFEGVLRLSTSEYKPIEDLLDLDCQLLLDLVGVLERRVVQEHEVVVLGLQRGRGGHELGACGRVGQQRGRGLGVGEQLPPARVFREHAGGAVSRAR